MGHEFSHYADYILKMNTKLDLFLLWRWLWRID